jgi:uncharacterized protein YxeA
MAEIRYNWGICTNTDKDGNGSPCPKCASKEPQKIPERKDFVCSECGEGLTKIQPPQGGLDKKLLLLIIAVVTIIIIVICAILFTGGHNKAVKQNEKILDSTKVDSAKPSTVDNTKNLNYNNTTSQTENVGKNTDGNIENNATTLSHSPKVVTVTKVIREKSEPSTNNTNGSLHLSYGSYKGDIKDGYPNGMGRLTYSHCRQINRYDNKERTASVGDYVIGEFVNGFFVQGKHFNSDGNLIETLMIGVPAGNAYESK